MLVDRISHEVTCYQPVLKLAALYGTRVINNPFFRIADDKFFNAGARRSASASPCPKTYVLPSKDYVEGVTSETLHNLCYPLDWEGMVAGPRPSRSS